MVSPEKSGSLGELRKTVIEKTQSLLGEPHEYHSILFDGEGIVSRMALAIRGHTSERSGSLIIADGSSSVTILEFSTRRLGIKRRNQLLVYAEDLSDGSGAFKDRPWCYDLYSQKEYPREVYELLDKLLDSEEGEERDELYAQIKSIAEEDAAGESS